MANLRIIYDNAIDRVLTLTTSNTAGSLVADNMRIDKKSKVWRSTTLTPSITATWTNAEFLDGLVLPFTNLTSACTIRVTGFTNVADASPVLDTGFVLAAPYTALGLWSWGTVPLGVNAYSYGFNSYARIWFNTTYTLKKIVIEISDPTNASGYVEVGRVVAGKKWEPEYNTGYGIPVTNIDTSTNERTESGDMITNIGNRFKKISFDLAYMSAADRVSFNIIMKQNGVSKPVFISLFPNDTDAEKEQTYQIYGKMPQMSAMSITNPIQYSSQIEIEEI